VTGSADDEWHYPPGQYEAGLIHHLVRAGRAAVISVQFADNYTRPADTAFFRLPEGSRLHTATGPVTDEPDGSVRVRTEDGTPPAIVIQDPGAPVLSRVEGADWAPARVVRAPTDRSPHEASEPVRRIPVAYTDGLWSSPAPLLGKLVCRCPQEPTIHSGESRPEALAAPATAETRHDVVAAADGVWTTVHSVGLRHVRVTGTSVHGVDVMASQRPFPRPGHFACSDDLLNRVWQASATTLRSCAHGLLIDGPKRDRMPWMGDLAAAIVPIAYALGDPQLCLDTLVALGDPQSGYVNGIADYSLWWVIGHHLLARHADIGDHLAARADHLHRFLGDLATNAGDDGLFRPRATPSDFNQLIFLDWGVEVDPARYRTAVQMLWIWALQTARDVLGAVGHSGADRWARLAGLASATLTGRAWDRRAGAWRDYADDDSPCGLHANAFAILAGIGPADGPARVVRRGPRARTPFMTGLALSALLTAGFRREAVEHVRNLWGGLLIADPELRTVPEEFAEGTKTPFEMYGRPYGKSLCHAWSAAPAALLPQAVLGIRPLDDGCKRVSVAPDLGSLAFAEARVPLPQGDLVVSADAGGFEVAAPPGVEVITTRPGEVA
jgi:alpha-L-rhamnosidase